MNDTKSLPSWERGLKHTPFIVNRPGVRVAPFVGAWIETFHAQPLHLLAYVAPFVGAWIETEE